MVKYTGSDVTKIEVLQAKVEKNPSDPFLWRDLCIELLSKGSVVEAVAVIQRALQALPRTLTLPEKFHKPILGALQERGEAQYMEILCRDLDVHYDAEGDEVIKRIVRKARRAIRKAYQDGVPFPDNMPEEVWWSGGAHLAHPKGVDLILPGKVVKAEGGVATIMLMSLTDHEHVIETEYLEVPFSELGVTGNKGAVLVNRCLEMGICTGDGTVTFQFH